MNASSNIIASVARIRQHGVHGADSSPRDARLPRPERGVKTERHDLRRAQFGQAGHCARVDDANHARLVAVGERWHKRPVASTANVASEWSSTQKNKPRRSGACRQALPITACADVRKPTTTQKVASSCGPVVRRKA
jgi:hypothetical protein